ncbi:MAG: sugar phosphate isomerase/epimerase [Treponema sp.]|nr:sugar phosphate isomerase/epimerase [Treponema sp.]
MYKSLNAGMVNIKLSGFKETLALAHKHGYGAVEYDPLSLEKQGIGVSQAWDLMGNYGIIISNFGLPVSCQTRDAFNESFPKLEKAARLARALGISRCCTWMASSSGEFDYAENFKRHKDMMGLCAQVLKDYDIAFGIEFIGPKQGWTGGKYPFIHTLPAMLELCDAIGTGNVGLLLDAHHCYTSGLPGGSFAPLLRSEKDIVLVHLNDDKKGVSPDDLPDSPRYYPGEPGGGANDVKAFMKALLHLGYTGPVVVEPFSEALKTMNDNDAIAKLIAESTDSVWPE